MKAMLSQPMAGKSEEEIKATREKARGCRIEYAAAVAYGLNIIYEE